LIFLLIAKNVNKQNGNVATGCAAGVFPASVCEETTHK